MLNRCDSCEAYRADKFACEQCQKEMKQRIKHRRTQNEEQEEWANYEHLRD